MPSTNKWVLITSCGHVSVEVLELTVSSSYKEGGRNDKYTPTATLKTTHKDTTENWFSQSSISAMFGTSKEN